MARRTYVLVCFHCLRYFTGFADELHCEQCRKYFEK